MNKINIIVQLSGFVDRNLIIEKDRGSLFVVEESKLPFKLSRFYIIYDVPNSDVLRGGHAHKITDQVLFVIKGSCLLHLDDGKVDQKFLLTSKDCGIRLKPMLWHAMSDISHDCLIIVATSQEYNESDYIRNYEEFKQKVEGTI